ncbi:DUF397 domain-containing protein [Streptomyces sp. cg35]|uniref:DUF397 domain-containing protein n=1 Tax=Streptomyces sp. cg35 TaxID=3421650 RepID=UPI003D178371
MAITPETTELYDRPVTGEFAAFCGDNSGDTMESCVTIADLGGGGFALRDSKLEGAAAQPELRMSADEITTFAEGWLRKHGPAAS